MIGAIPSDYRILISRSPQRPKAQLYAFSLRQPIPAFPIPLRTGEQEPILELQPLLYRVYDRARLELARTASLPVDEEFPPTVDAQSKVLLHADVTDLPLHDIHKGDRLK